MKKKEQKTILLLAPNYKPGRLLNARCDLISWCNCQWWPLQLAPLGAFLESKGYFVQIIDAQAENLTDEETGFKVGNIGPDYAIIYAGRESIDWDVNLCNLFNKKICPSKLAGNFYALNKEKSPGLYGELETAALDWIEGRVDAKLPICGKRLTSEELDAIPFVSEFCMRHLNFSNYVAPSEPWPFIDIMTGRGCYYGQCTFCLWPQTYGHGYTTRSIQNVVAELEFIEKKTPFKSVMIEDDSLPESRIVQLCEEKIKRNIKIQWSCLVRANISRETLFLMKKANCLNVHTGFESGNPATIEKLNKGISVFRAEVFAKDAREAGLQVHADIMIGVEGKQETLHTIDWVCDVVRPHTAQFQIFIPYFMDNPVASTSGDSNYELSRYAYKKFYSKPRNWGSVLEQLKKPKILRSAIKNVIGI